MRTADQMWRRLIGALGAAAVVAAMGQALLGWSSGTPTGDQAGGQGTGTVVAPQAPAGGRPSAQAPAQAPTFRTGVNFVRVDVIVSDKAGNPVTDLKAEDFDVIEDGKVQPIEMFRLVNISGQQTPESEPARRIRSRSDEEAEAARDDVRLFVIFLDDYHVRLGNSMRIREPLSRFLQTQVGPLDMVAIMYPLMSVNDVTFTRDRDVIEHQIRAFEGRKYDYRPRNSVEEKSAYYPTQTIETLRNQVTISALEGLCVRLGSLREGRKAVILVSEGFTALLPPQMRDPMGALKGQGNSAANNPMAGDNRVEDRARFQAMIDLEQWMRDIYTAANRNNTAIYALDPRGLAVNEFDINENVGGHVDSETLRQSMDSLRTLAAETDGRAIINQNDVDRGLRQVMRDSSAYYLVGYNTTAKADGKFHKIDVKVKRPGVQVRARKGYWAATAAELATVAAAPAKPKPAPEVERALGTMDGRSREALTVSWLQMLPGTDGRTRVSFVWEPIPAQIGVARLEPAAVRLKVSGPDGQTVFEGRVPEAVDPPVAAPAAGTALPAPASAVAKPARTVFEAKPGRHQFRLAIEDAKGQNLDASAMEVVIPDLTGVPLRLSAPAVFRARTAREFQALSRDPDPVPSALRAFRRTERLLIRFQAAQLGDVPVTPNARLLNRNGQKMLDVAVKPPSDGGAFFQIDLPLAGLAAGDYLVEVVVEGSAGKASELVPLRVTS